MMENQHENQHSPIDNRDSRIDNHESGIVYRKSEIDNRKSAIDNRKSAIDNRESAIDNRESGIGTGAVILSHLAFHNCDSKGVVCANAHVCVFLLALHLREK